MARLLVGDAQAAKAEVEAKGFVDVMEPICGAGGMVIAMADALRAAGLNYQQVMHATCVDIDLRCVHMTFLQLSLLHVPAAVVHGNSLSGEVWSRWHTPAHALGGWRYRLQRRYASEMAPGLMAQPSTGEPSAQAGDAEDEAPQTTPPADAASQGVGATPPPSRAIAQTLLFGSDDFADAARTPSSGVEHARRRGKLGQGGDSDRQPDEKPPTS